MRRGSGTTFGCELRTGSGYLVRTLIISLMGLLALLLGGGFELHGHHDHDPFVADGGCALCRLADAPVDGTAPPPVVPEPFEAPGESAPVAPDLRIPAERVDPSHPLRGPPQV